MRVDDLDLNWLDNPDSPREVFQENQKDIDNRSTGVISLTKAQSLTRPYVKLILDRPILEEAFSEQAFGPRERLLNRLIRLRPRSEETIGAPSENSDYMPVSTEPVQESSGPLAEAEIEAAFSAASFADSLPPIEDLNTVSEENLLATDEPVAETALESSPEEEIVVPAGFVYYPAIDTQAHVLLKTISELHSSVIDILVRNELSRQQASLLRLNEGAQVADLANVLKIGDADLVVSYLKPPSDLLKLEAVTTNQLALEQPKQIELLHIYTEGRMKYWTFLGDINQGAYIPKSDISALFLGYRDSDILDHDLALYKSAEALLKNYLNFVYFSL